MKDRQKKIRFGISTRLSLAIGLSGIVIAVISYGIATRLNKTLTIATVMDKNWVIADNLLDDEMERDMAAIIEKGKMIYDSIPEQERVNPEDKSYQSRYDSLKDADYESVLERISQSADVPRVMWADLRFKDEEKGRYVYVMHTGASEDDTYSAGFWENKDDRINAAVEALSSKDPDQEQFLYLPQWMGKITKKLPESMANVFFIIDHLLLVDSRHIQNRFSVLYPVKSQDTGKTIGYISIGDYYKNYQTYSWAFAFVFVAVLIPYFIIVYLLAKYLAGRSIAGPIQELAYTAVAYGEDEDKEQHGEHFINIPIRSRDEVLLLRDSMADMENSLMKYMEKLKKMAARQERIKAEMDMSAQIQLGMLPQSLDGDEEKRDFTISASIKPAKAVGGDFYDFFEIDEDRIGIVMADVSGKGMPAALFMMISKIIISAEARRGTSVEDIMRRANRQVCANNPEMLFVTVWFGIYYIKDRTIRYVNAGHDYPALLRHSEGKFSLVEKESDIVMGFDPDIEFVERTLLLEQGDKVFLYTDGIPEAHNKDEEMYGNDRMLEALNKNASQTGKAFLDAIDADARSFIGKADQFDDMTMLLLEVK